MGKVTIDVVTERKDGALVLVLVHLAIGSKPLTGRPS